MNLILNMTIKTNEMIILGYLLQLYTGDDWWWWSRWKWKADKMMRRWKHKRKGVQPKGRRQENRREQESWGGKDEQDFTFTFGHKLHDRGVLQLPHRRMNYSIMFQCLFYSSTASNYLHSCKEQLSTHIYGCVFCVRSWCFAVKCTSVCLTKGL